MKSSLRLAVLCICGLAGNAWAQPIDESSSQAKWLKEATPRVIEPIETKDF